jgi:hypothetical protein
LVNQVDQVHVELLVSEEKVDSVASQVPLVQQVPQDLPETQGRLVQLASQEELEPLDTLDLLDQREQLENVVHQDPVDLRDRRAS